MTYTTAAEMLNNLQSRIEAAMSATPAQSCEESFAAYRDAEVSDLRRRVAEIEADPQAFERDAKDWAAKCAEVGAAFGL